MQGNICKKKNYMAYLDYKTEYCIQTLQSRCWIYKMLHDYFKIKNADRLRHRLIRDSKTQRI